MTKKLHILFLCSWFPSKEFPTNGDFIQRHAKAISLKHSVSVLHIVSSKQNAKTTIEKSVEKNVTTYIGYVKHTKNPILKAIRFYKAYVQILKLIGNYDLMHVNTLYPFGLFALHQKIIKRKPYIISEHWTGYLKSRKYSIPFFQKMCSKLIVKKATFVCPVSNELKKEMQDLGLKGNYIPVGNVIDTALFIPSNEKNIEFPIVHVSGLNNAQKNISGMLQVAKLLENSIPGFTWKFIGGSSEKYQKIIDKLEFKTAKIEFLNHVSQKELAKHLQKATVCVSFSNYETFGIVSLEAIACGTYTITTNTGILNELELQDFFSIIPVKDKNTLTKEIMTQYNNPTKLEVEKMHLFVKDQFNQDIIAEAFSKLYFKSLNRNS